MLSCSSSAAGPVTTNDAVVFSAAASDANNDALSYTWDFGDGTSASSASVSHTYRAPGTYTATVTVNDGRGGTSSGSVIVTAIPPFGVKINFQPAGAPIPSGYLADTGVAFADRGNGYSYGWNADNTFSPKDRDAANSPDQRYDTLCHMQKPQLPNATWEIAVPNGSYTVRIVSGDPSYFNSVYKVSAEGVVVVDATPTETVRWFEGTKTVTVGDGRLTVGNAAGSNNNKICFIEISNGTTAGARSITADVRSIAADAPPAEPLTVTKLQVKMNFASSGRDGYVAAGALPTLEKGTSVEGMFVSVDVGAAIVDFLLDKKGGAKTKNGTFMLKFNAKTGWVFSANVKSGCWLDRWTDGGLENTTVAHQPAILPVTLTLGTRVFGGGKAVHYSAKAHRAGQAK
jgi:PKD repeat protein